MTDAVIAYCGTHDIGYAGITVERAEKANLTSYGTAEPVYCNVSHSGNLWIAIVGPGECGIDLQRVTDCKFEQISRRYFSPDERSRISHSGNRTVGPGEYRQRVTDCGFFRPLGRILPPLGQTGGFRQVYRRGLLRTEAGLRGCGRQSDRLGRGRLPQGSADR